MKYQVIITDSLGRTWDAIRPTRLEALQRIGQYLSLEDESRLIHLGDRLVACVDFIHAVEISSHYGFKVTIKTIEV